MEEDWRLLRQFRDKGSQAAFSRLVERHMRMVYWTCRRDLGSDQEAEDSTQAVFLLFAQKAPSLRPGTPIHGWLFTTARLVCKNARRSDARRRRYEQEAAMQGEMDTQNAGWQQIEPWVNDGLSALSAGDRNVLLLRYFEGLSVIELAGTLGATESAAKMRVSRALERLRDYLGKKDIAVSPMLLPALLAEHSTQAAPAHMAAQICQTAGAAVSSPPLLGDGGLVRGGFLLAKGLLLMSTTKIVAGGAAAVIAILAVTFFAVHKLHSAPPAGPQAVTWQAPPAASTSDQQAQQQIRQEMDQWSSCVNSGDVQGTMAIFSPNFAVTVGRGRNFGYQDLQRTYARHMQQGSHVWAHILSCSVSGNTATVVMKSAWYRGSPKISSSGGGYPAFALIFTNTSGRWLCTGQDGP